MILQISDYQVRVLPLPCTPTAVSLEGHSWTEQLLYYREKNINSITCHPGKIVFQNQTSTVTGHRATRSYYA